MAGDFHVTSGRLKPGQQVPVVPRNTGKTIEVRSEDLLPADDGVDGFLIIKKGEYSQVFCLEAEFFEEAFGSSFIEKPIMRDR